MDKRKNRINSWRLPLLAFVVIIGIWEISTDVFNINKIILPDPYTILISIITNWNILIKHTSITMIEALFGFIIGTLIGILIAILFVYFSKAKQAFYPYAIALKATPLYALAPLLVMWFGSGIFSKIVMSALVAFFPILVNTVKGLTSVEQESYDLFRSLSASKWQVFTKLRLPNALPYIFTALKISTTLSVVGATIAEFTGSSMGIGHLIVNASYYLDTSLMFSGIVMISLAGVLFFYFVDYIEQKMVFWQKND
ncbi:ABC transporter permease [Candidatus Woesearchaeota archaeon]|nr:ABC transporter permease [Candidatus Woesearchaeota archaeon]